jgi:hypothetical protein
MTNHIEPSLPTVDTAAFLVDKDTGFVPLDVPYHLTENGHIAVHIGSLLTAIRISGSSSNNDLLFRMPDIAPPTSYKLADDRIELFPDEKVAVADSDELRLPKACYELLELFARNPGRLLSRPTITAAWNYKSFNVRLHQLRKTLGPELGSPPLGAIRYDPGNGYKGVRSLLDKTYIPSYRYQDAQDLI